MMNAMIDLAATYGIADRCHFPGFQRGNQVYMCYKNSDVFVMPSVSEPFGIAPLEAMQCGCPSIISKQSGCGEILSNVIKVDYWDINAMADAIYSLCTNEGLHRYLREEGLKEVAEITWVKVGHRIRKLYDECIYNGGFIH
jgi:glycosyltransferase involved in cell wall biosynthesis